MNFGMIRNIIGKILVLVGLLMMIPLITALVFSENIRNIISYLIPMATLMTIGGLMGYLFPAKDKQMGVKEGYVIVGLSWILMSLFGCLPFLISGYVTDFFTAFFEMVSGFTTTGSSALSATELNSMLTEGGRSLLMWRSFSHWIGGMGILVFILSIILDSKEGSMLHVLRAESPGPQVGKLVSKMKITTRILYLIYIGLTIIEIIALNICHIFDSNMTFYDSLIMTFGTAGTGGFATTTLSAGLYAPCSQYVIATFMIIFGINFTLYYYLLIKNYKEVIKNEEIRWYLIVVAIAVIVITIQIQGLYETFEEGFRHAYFQVASIISTTGYSTVDYANTWPALSLVILLILMLAGSCAGSTAGGIKQSRVIIMVKYSKSKLVNLISPRKVNVIRLDGKTLDNSIVDSTVVFFVIYIMMIIVSTFLISIWNPNMPEGDSNPLTMFSASLACISNIGPGLGAVGPAGGFAQFSWFSKLVLAFLMLAGRLELFPILILFFPGTWKKNI